MSGASHPVGNDDGFALIEVLVAFVVLALGLAGVYATLANSARLQTELAMRDGVMSEANALVDRLVTGPLAAGESNGRFATGAAWRAVVTPLPRFIAAPDVTTQPASVIVTVTDASRQTLARFDTIALIPAAQIPGAP